MTRRRLGTIVRLQVHAAVISRAEGYEPSHLLAVDEAAIGPQGMAGLREGAWVLDVHHEAHPEAAGGGRRAVSVGFAGHYRLMAGRFGEVPLGIGAENLVVDTARRVTAADLTGTVVVEGEFGAIPLHSARPAKPCRQFTSFLLGRGDVAPREEIGDDLAFLGDGMRGFILEADRVPRPIRVRRGDEVWVAPD